MNRRCVCIFAHHFPYILSILISFYCYCNSSESFLPRLISKPTKWLKIDVKNYEVKEKKQIEIDPLLTKHATRSTLKKYRKKDFDEKTNHFHYFIETYVALSILLQ